MIFVLLVTKMLTLPVFALLLRDTCCGIAFISQAYLFSHVFDGFNLGICVIASLLHEASHFIWQSPEVYNLNRRWDVWWCTMSLMCMKYVFSLHIIAKKPKFLTYIWISTPAAYYLVVSFLVFWYDMMQDAPNDILGLSLQMISSIFPTIMMIGFCIPFAALTLTFLDVWTTII
jgi:hypothetical protein